MDETYATYPGATSRQMAKEYDGDLRKLREAADEDPGDILKQLKKFEGISGSGASIFCREVQQVGDELNPFSDDKALADLIDQDDVTRLVSAPVRADLENDIDMILDAA